MRRIIGCCIYSLAFIAASQLNPTALSSAQERLQSRSEISEKQLESFAKAYVGYQRLRQIYEPKIAKALDVRERERIRQEGDAKVSQVLAQEGLTAQTYNRLFTAVNNERELRQRVLKLIHDERRRS